MLVCVTGGTGFVGAHSVAALVRGGHRVRLLVRSSAGVDRALAPLNVDIDAVEVVLGDITDQDSVARAVRGVDGVLHAAALFSFDSRQHAAMRRTNATGTDLVLTAARRVDANPIVHVSSFAALLPAAQRVVTADSPIGRSGEAYLKSKAAAETIARGHQEAGAPVVITYPPAVLGPDDPHLGDQNARLRNTLRGLMPIWPTGGLPIGDVRDTAALHAGLFAAPVATPGPNQRYFGPSSFVTTAEYVRAVRTVTGRAVPAVFLPAKAMLAVGALVDLVQRGWRWHIPAEYGAIYTVGCATRIDERADTAGVAGRPVTESLGDTVRWLWRSGLLSDRQAGLSAGAPPERDAVAGPARPAR